MVNAEFIILGARGWWDEYGYWHHNPKLQLSYKQQKAENEANGYRCEAEPWSPPTVKGWNSNGG